MTTRRTYRGFGLSGIDGKGRLAIPAKLRGALEHNAGADRTLILSPSRSAPCLMGYDTIYAEQMPEILAQEMAEAEPDAPKMSRDNRNRLAFGLVDEAPFDQSGRMVIPPMLRKLAKLEDLAFFHGSGAIIEIWNPHVLIATPDVPAMMVELVQFLLDERAAA